MITIHNYSEKAIAVTGTSKATDILNEVLRKTGGKFNAYLRVGPGWVFSKKHQAAVQRIVAEWNANTQADDSINTAAYVQAQEDAYWDRATGYN
jgi:hypothetical protein